LIDQFVGSIASIVNAPHRSRVLPLILLAVFALSVVSATGCGNSDDDVQQAVDKALKEEHEKERQQKLESEQKKLKKELNQLKRDRKKGSSGGSSSSASESCGDGISVNANTTCSFARNVAETFRVYGPGSIDVWSPVTERSYAMYCSSGSPTRCTGGNNALVVIR
jgi:uncharacterized protein YlxW (UPF0749 family)